MINQEQQPLVVIQQPQGQIITTQPQIVQTQPVVVIQDGIQQTTQPNTVPTDAVQTKPEPTQTLNTANMNFGAKMVLGANAVCIIYNIIIYIILCFYTYIIYWVY